MRKEDGGNVISRARPERLDENAGIKRFDARAQQVDLTPRFSQGESRDHCQRARRIEGEVGADVAEPDDELAAQIRRVTAETIGCDHSDTVFGAIAGQKKRKIAGSGGGGPPLGSAKTD